MLAASCRTSRHRPAGAGYVPADEGPSVGAPPALALTEGLRVWLGTDFIGAANTIYGILLVLCVIPAWGVVGALLGLSLKRSPQAAKPARGEAVGRLRNRRLG